MPPRANPANPAPRPTAQSLSVFDRVLRRVWGRRTACFTLCLGEALFPPLRRSSSCHGVFGLGVRRVWGASTLCFVLCLAEEDFGSAEAAQSVFVYLGEGRRFDALR